MNIQLHQTLKLKSGYCKGKILSSDNTETCFLVELMEGLFKVGGQKGIDLPVGSKLIISKDECWQYTQKIEAKGTIVSEQRIAFPIKNIVGTIINTEDENDGTDSRK